MRNIGKKSGQKGSALLIVMLLVTVLMTVALTAGYLTMAEVSMETSSEDGVMAYYAAEAGIEDGLLRYRYDNNVEVGVFPPAAIELVDRVDMEVSSRTSNISPTSPPTDNLKQYYDLRIKYKEDNSSSYSSNVTTSDKELKKDETLTLDGFSLVTTVSFKYKSSQAGCTAALQNCLVQFKGTTDPGGVKIASFVSSSADQTISVFVNPGASLTIKPWGMNINYKIMATDSSSLKFLDSGYTTIESTGYYGASKRRLQAKIDRKSGKLLEIFDFTLNSINGRIN